MVVDCPRCGFRLEYSSHPPRFCSDCGRPLSTADVATAAALPLEMQPTRAHLTASGASRGAPPHVAGYRLLRPIGSGGMGTVYEAEDPASGRHVAVKIIRPEFADSPDAVERFRREGRLASTLSHPRCVFVLAADEEGGVPYIIMELMTGSTLADLVAKRGPLPQAEAVRYILDAIEGLQEAHHAGVIHRDVKPSNCFLDAEGRVKVGDFGLAKSLIGQDALTRSGAFLGTYLFASPEQIRNARVDGRTDIYSVCATLYYLLTGRAPFDDTDPAAALAKTVSDPLQPMRELNPGLPRTLDEVVMKGLARDRDKRWATLEDLRLALMPFVEGPHSLGELAARSAAYLLDVLILILPPGLLLQSVVGPGLRSALPPAAVPLAQFGITFLLYLVTFGVLESVLGYTPGKWLLGLRVPETATGDRPTPRRSLLRTALFIVLTDGLVGLASAAVLLHGPPLQAPGEGMTAKLLVGHLGIALVPLLTTAAGACIVASTMRRRTGYRGLHEWLSGTSVIRLPDPRPRFVLPARQEWPTQTGPPKGLPHRLGGFRVLGPAWQAGGESVLYAADASLDRPAWLWLRQGPPLPTRRRALSRPGRARWLAGGERDGGSWEAFLATPGCLLTDLASLQKLDWPDAMRVLEQLAGELAAAEADGSLPPALYLEQVWTQADGRTVLLDAPARAPAVALTPMRLLQQAAAVALEGAPRPEGKIEGPIRAPIPGHAADLLACLMSGRYASAARFAEALAVDHGMPAEISRPARAMQLVFTAVLLAPGLLMMFLLGPALLGLALVVCVAGRVQAEARMEGDAADLAAGLVTRPAGVELLGGLAWMLEDMRPHADDLARLDMLGRQRAAVMESYSWYMRRGFDRLEQESRAKGTFRLPEPEVVPADPVLTDSDDLTGGPAPLAREMLLNGWWLLIAVFFWPLAWAFLAALLGGGVSGRLGGVRLLDAEGRRAAMWRLHLRTLIVWLPVAGLLGLSLAVDLLRVARSPEAATQPILAWIAWGAWWLALGLLPSYVWTAIRTPGRGPHDRIAGTYPVPG